MHGAPSRGPVPTAARPWRRLGGEQRERDDQQAPDEARNRNETPAHAPIVQEITG